MASRLLLFFVQHLQFQLDIGLLVIRAALIILRSAHQLLCLHLTVIWIWTWSYFFSSWRSTAPQLLLSKRLITFTILNRSEIWIIPWVPSILIIWCYFGNVLFIQGCSSIWFAVFKHLQKVCAWWASFRREIDLIVIQLENWLLVIEL